MADKRISLSESVKKLLLFIFSLLLVIAALACSFYLVMARVDTAPEFLEKRSVAYLHLVLWPLAVGLHLFSRLPEPAPHTQPPTNWMAQTFGQRDGAAVERLWIVLLVAGVAWYISSSAMQSEYARMKEPEKRQDCLYGLTRI